MRDVKLPRVAFPKRNRLPNPLKPLGTGLSEFAIFESLRSGDCK